MKKVSISKGNSKMGKVWNISLTPVKACKGCEDICGGKCYAMKSYKMYPNVRNAWDGNLESANEDLHEYFTQIQDTILKARKTPKFFRWHVAGDIISKDYFKGMVRLALAFQDTKFLVFTKQYDIVNEFIEKYQFYPSNFTVVFSGWPGLPMNNTHNLPVAWMQDGTETRTNGKEISCPGNCETCGMCWALPSIGKSVVFDAH